MLFLVALGFYIILQSLFLFARLHQEERRKERYLASRLNQAFVFSASKHHLIFWLMFFYSLAWMLAGFAIAIMSATQLPSETLDLLLKSGAFPLAAISFFLRMPLKWFPGFIDLISQYQRLYEKH